MPEYCESMMKKQKLDEQFFDDGAVIPSITIFSYEPAPAEDMGFFAPGYKKLDNRDERKNERKKDIKTERKKEKKRKEQNREEKK